MGILGEKITVDLNRYFKALEVFHGGEKVSELRSSLEEFGIKGTVDIYEGEQYDGNIVIKYFLKRDNVRGVLTLSDNGNYASEAANGAWNKDLMDDFVHGLFDPAAAHYLMKTSFGMLENDEYCANIQSASEILKAHEACWLAGSRKACDYEGISHDWTVAQEQKELCLLKLEEKGMPRRIE